MLRLKNRIAVLVVMMSCGLSATAQDENDITPLMRAVRDEELNKVKGLLKQGVDLEAKDAIGWTALFYAVAMGDDRAVKALLDKGANVNAASNDGGTSLMLAAQSQRDKIVKLLIACGADINTRDKDGNSALTLAARGGRTKTYNLIEKAGGLDPKSSNPSTTDNTKGSNITRPVPLNHPRPNYTDRASEARIEGVVRVLALVGTDGNVKQVRVVKGLPHGLTEEAVNAVKMMRFKPAMKDGVHVEYWMPVELEFEM